MMLRLRRYRVFLFFAVVIVFVFVRFSRRTQFVQQGTRKVEAQEPIQFTPAKPKTQGQQQQSTAQPQITSEKVLGNARSSPAPATRVTALVEEQKTAAFTSSQAAPSKTQVASIAPPLAIPDRKPPPPTVVSEDDTVDIHPVAPPGRQEEPLLEALPEEIIHWVKQKEHFPVPTESLIHLPSGKPLRIPTIQYAFDDETPNEKIEREMKQKQVRDEFQKAWAGYKKNAWLHDELSPVTGKFRDPFCGWAATLVDTLDTLWIMGLEEDFDEAARAVDKIDFTTSPRGDIPMFETTIRYLGGLLAAYDVSGRKYKNLLDKAVELAEILMGAFDTPNRMPVLYYHWKPTFASQAHRASGRSNLAELGSLSLEFTRLAQLTNDPRYYDAVARVTNALDEWQDRGTLLPGIFPENVDASGCNRTVDMIYSQPMNSPNFPNDPIVPGAEPVGYQGPAVENVKEPKPNKNPTANDRTLQFEITPGAPGKAHIKDWDEAHPKAGGEKTDVKKPVKRQLMDGPQSSTEGTAPPSMIPTPTIPTHPLTGLALDTSADGTAQMRADAAGEICKPQGLVSTGSDKYSMGGGQDSTYEYFPKVRSRKWNLIRWVLLTSANNGQQYLLLGGLETKYRKMYNMTMQAVRKHMIYRPMIPGDPDILFSGALDIYSVTKPEDRILTTEVEHLTCFIGGMVGMGAKIFGIDGDLEIAKKLTEGCVWAYSSTATGIMAEGAHVLPCVSAEKCTWNETAYHYALDPLAATRDADVAEYVANKAAREKLEEGEKAAAKKQAQTDAAIAAKSEADAIAGRGDLSDGTSTEMPSNGTSFASLKKDGPVSLQKRQKALEESQLSPTDVDLQKKLQSTEAELKAVSDTGYAKGEPLLQSNDEALVDPSKPMTHSEYVASRIKQESLPPGYTLLKSRKYILR
jgi:mannosyl-oligosaccharide alpha-1,2-mannosidase